MTTSLEVVYHPAAILELEQAVQYYEGQREGLGLRLLDIVANAEGMLVTHPEAGISVGSGCRRKGLTTFPVGLFYRVQAERLEIIAVAHEKRRPGYWLDRLS